MCISWTNKGLNITKMHGAITKYNKGVTLTRLYWGGGEDINKTEN